MSTRPQTVEKVAHRKNLGTTGLTTNNKFAENVRRFNLKDARLFSTETDKIPLIVRTLAKFRMTNFTISNVENDGNNCILGIVLDDPLDLFDSEALNAFLKVL